MKWPLRIGLILLLVLAAAVAVIQCWRPGLADYAAHRYPDSPIPPGALTATWFGVTAVLLRDGQHAVMADPFFSRPPGMLNALLNRRIEPDEARISAWLQRAGVEHLDAVLVSHSHYDHAMDAGAVARLTGATLLGSESSLNIGRGAGLPESQLRRVEPGARYPFGSFGVRFIESAHAGATGGRPTGEIDAPLVPPARYLDYRLGGTYSIVVEHPQGRVLLHGSAGFRPGMLRGERADLVFLGVAAVDDLETYLRETVGTVGARRVIPTHWDDFWRPLEQPLRPLPLSRLDHILAGLRAHPELRVQTLEPGQTVALFQASSSPE
ncbi:MAG: MBL fold metallo-hydrolase [Stagnimonas sp.]|nr:MBL fold metallo-hydrolase [Stagnimonas sp.]